MDRYINKSSSSIGSSRNCLTFNGTYKFCAPRIKDTILVDLRKENLSESSDRKTTGGKKNE